MAIRWLALGLAAYLAAAWHLSPRATDVAVHGPALALAAITLGTRGVACGVLAGWLGLLVDAGHPNGLGGGAAVYLVVAWGTSTLLLDRVAETRWLTWCSLLPCAWAAAVCHPMESGQPVVSAELLATLLVMAAGLPAVPACWRPEVGDEAAPQTPWWAQTGA